MKKGVLRQIVEVDCALTVTYLVGRWAVHCAYVERGCPAVGGEWLLIIFVYWGTYRAVRAVFNHIDQKRGVYGGRYKEKRDREADRMRRCG